MALAIMAISILAMVVHFKRITPTYRKALDYISRGWDGKSESELEKLLLNDEEEKLIKKYNRLIIIWALIGITNIALYLILLGINLGDGINPFILILACILFAPYYAKMYNLDVTVKELKSGLYKHNYHCNKCGTNIIFTNDSNEKVCPDCKIELVKLNISDNPFLQEERKSRKLIIYTVVILLTLLVINLVFIAPTIEQSLGQQLEEINDNLDNTQETLNRFNESVKESQNIVSNEELDSMTEEDSKEIIEENNAKISKDPNEAEDLNNEDSTNGKKEAVNNAKEAVNNAKDASSNIHAILEKMKEVD